ncbi:MAG: outer membrane beta-barrel protein [Saprospiraceae bacterium]
MKTISISTLLLIFFSPIFSQSNQSLDIITGIDLSFRYLNQEGDGQQVQNVLEGRNEGETPKLNWRFGFNYNLKVSQKLFIKSGLRLASVGYNGKKLTGLKWGSEYDGMGGWIHDPSLPHEIQFKYDYWFLEIPVALRYEIKESKWSPYFELGIAPSFYLGELVTKKTDIGKEVEFTDNSIYDYQKIHLVGLIAFGVNYNLSQKLQLFGQPTFRYHFAKLFEAPIEEYLYNGGLEIGLRRRF